MSDGPTTVLVNLCWLVPGVVGGSEEATTNALKALVEHMPDDLRIRLAVLEPFLEAHPDLAASVPHDVLPVDGSNKMRRVVGEHTWLARIAGRIGADVVHHAGGVVPLIHPGRIVVTIHDLQPLDMPQNFSRTKLAYLTAMLGRSARCAEVLCVPSAFTGSRVTELLGVDPDRVVEVPWWIADRSEAHSHAVAVPAEIRDRRFVLYPAIAYPHKRHELLVDAFAPVADHHRDVDLVLTGGPGPVQSRVSEQIVRLGLAERVHQLGRVPPEVLDGLYRRADAVVIPSSYEGFGLPALEAMGRGCPVVAANLGSLPEVVPSSSLVDGDGVGDWSAAIEKILTSTAEERREQIRAGAASAARFTPVRTAEALVGAYRLAAARSHDRTRRKDRPGNRQYRGS